MFYVARCTVFGTRQEQATASGGNLGEEAKCYNPKEEWKGSKSWIMVKRFQGLDFSLCSTVTQIG